MGRNSRVRAGGRVAKADGDGKELSDEELKRLRGDTADGTGASKAEGDDDDDDGEDDEATKADLDDGKQVTDSDLDADGTEEQADETTKADGDDDDDEDDDDDQVGKSAKGGAHDSLHKAIVKLSRRIDASDPEVRKDALFAKSKVADLTAAEADELTGLIKGQAQGLSLRARSVGKMSKSALQSIQGSDVMREAMGAVAQSHGVLADEIEGFRKSAQATQMLMGRALAEMGKQVIKLREENQAQQVALEKALRVPARAPKAHTGRYLEKGEEKSAKPGDFEAVYKGLQEAYTKGGKASPHRAELNKALFDLTYSGEVSDSARKVLKAATCAI